MSIEQAFANIVRTFWQVRSGTAPAEINFCLNALWIVGVIWIVVWADYKIASGAARDRKGGWDR